MSVMFAFLILYINEIGEINYKRESERLYERLAILMKLEKRMGLLDKKRSKEEREELFQKDELYVPERWKKDWNLESEKDLVKKMISTNRKSYFSNSIRIFKVIKNAALVILVINLLLIVVYCLLKS